MKKRATILAASLALIVSLGACGTQEPKVENVEDMEYTITMQVWGEDGLTPEEIQRDGLYTGETLDGIPNGSGSFKSQNPEGNEWNYEGDFANGTFHGQGTCTWDADGVVPEVGTYENGLFKPTKSEFLDMSPKLILNNFSLPEKTKEFINAHENLFPCTDEAGRAELDSLVDETLGYKQISKNADPYTGSVVHIGSLEALQVFEKSDFGYTYTIINAQDGDWNYYTVFYLGTIDIYEGDYFSVYGVPTASTSYDNALGGQTNTIAIAGSLIEKA